ncbi:MAG: ECF transporter S component [Firmicutes bacterium]|nr:ECF transporter S component [Bacillota bacterium]
MKESKDVRDAVLARAAEETFFSRRRLVYLALLVALSAVGATLKIPSLTGTPALDSLPGYLAALLFGAREGGLVIALGHLLTALTAGFPLTIPIHLLIALGMAGCAAFLAWTGKKNLWLAGGLTILLNGVVFPAAFIPLPGFGSGFFAAMLVPLVVASTLNILLALVLYLALKRGFRRYAGSR